LNYWPTVPAFERRRDEECLRSIHSVSVIWQRAVGQSVGQHDRDVKIHRRPLSASLAGSTYLCPAAKLEFIVVSTRMAVAMKGGSDQQPDCE